MLTKRSRKGHEGTEPWVGGVDMSQNYDLGETQNRTSGVSLAYGGRVHGRADVGSGKSRCSTDRLPRSSDGGQGHGGATRDVPPPRRNAPFRL